MVTGLITVNGKQVLEVDADPSTAGGIAAPLGSLAMYDSGSIGALFIKTGAADDAWQQVDVPEGRDWQMDGNTLTGGSPTAPNEFFGSNNDYDVAFRRNATELMRLCSDGLLIGLNASLGGRLQVSAAALGGDLVKQISPNGGSGGQVIHVSRQYKVQTTDAVATTLADILLPNDNVAHITAKVVARQHGGSSGTAGDGAAYTREIHARTIAAVAAVRQNQTSFTAEDVNAFNLLTTVNGANVRLQAQGAANRNIAWFAQVEMLLATN